MPASVGRHLRNPAFWRLALAVFWLTLFALTHLPVEGPFAPITQYDKIAHGVAFAVLAALLATTWQKSAGKLSASQLVWAWLAVASYAALDEWTQSFVGRHTSAWDWTADAIGAALGLALFAWLRARIA